MLIVPSEKLSSEKPGQLSHSGLRSLERVHFFFEINASGFWHCQVVYSLRSVLYTLEVYSDSLNGTRPLCACTTKLSLLAHVTNPRFECSRLHTLIHSHIRTNVYQHVDCDCFKCASLGFQLFQCRLHSWCLGRYRSTEGICKQNWYSWLRYMMVIIVKFYILFVKHKLIYAYILWR